MKILFAMLSILSTATFGAMPIIERPEEEQKSAELVSQLSVVGSARTWRKCTEVLGEQVLQVLKMGERWSLGEDNYSTGYLYPGKMSWKIADKKTGESTDYSLNIRVNFDEVTPNAKGEVQCRLIAVSGAYIAYVYNDNKDHTVLGINRYVNGNMLFRQLTGFQYLGGMKLRVFNQEEYLELLRH